MNKEMWKKFEENYEISNLGNVRNISTKKILKTRTNKKGYLKTNISVHGKIKTIFPHRLVAEIFIPNPNNYPAVNHINGIKTDNKIDNLEWCTYSYNTRHAVKNGLIKSKKVIQLDLQNNMINEYESIAKACEINNFKPKGIYLVCCGIRKTSQGYKWAYK